MLHFSKHFERVVEGLWDWLSAVGVWGCYVCSLGLILDWFPSKKWEGIPVHGLRCVCSVDEACWTNGNLCTFSPIPPQGFPIIISPKKFHNTAIYYLFLIVVVGCRNKATCRVSGVLNKQFWPELSMASLYLTSTTSHTNISAVFRRQEPKFNRPILTGCRHGGRKNRFVRSWGRTSEVAQPLPIVSIDPDEGVWRRWGPWKVVLLVLSAPLHGGDIYGHGRVVKIRNNNGSSVISTAPPVPSVHRDGVEDKWTGGEGLWGVIMLYITWCVLWGAAVPHLALQRGSLDFKHEASAHLHRKTFWVPMGEGCWICCQNFCHWKCTHAGQGRGRPTSSQRGERVGKKEGGTPVKKITTREWGEV